MMQYREIRTSDPSLLSWVQGYPNVTVIQILEAEGWELMGPPVWDRATMVFVWFVRKQQRRDGLPQQQGTRFEALDIAEEVEPQ